MKRWLLWILLVAAALILLSPILGAVTFIGKTLIYIIGTVVLIGVIIWAMVMLSREEKSRSGKTP